MGIIEIQALDIKKAEKLKTKALNTFDLLMNEEVSLERILSKCVFINQSCPNQNKYRKKAINRLTVDFIPSFLPHSNNKYTKFIKNSQKLMNMNLQKKIKKFQKTDENQTKNEISRDNTSASQEKDYSSNNK